MLISMPTWLYVAGLVIFLVANGYLTKVIYKELKDDDKKLALPDFVLVVGAGLYGIFLAFIWPMELAIIILFYLVALAWTVYKRV